MKTLVLLIGTVLILGAANVWTQSVSLGIRKQIVQQMVSDGEIEASCVQQQGALKVVGVSILHLNKDTKPEFLVVGNGCACFGARRCFQWIYRQNGPGYEMIFEPEPAEEVRPLRTYANGYRNLMVSGWAGPEICSSTHKFDGRRYKSVESTFRCEKVR